MTTDELWLELIAVEQKSISVFGRPYLFISHESFAKFNIYFEPQFALFSQVENYRSNSWYKHIHAVKYANEVCVHIDHFNPNVSFWLNIPHGFTDVLPYMLWCLFNWKRPFGSEG